MNCRCDAKRVGVRFQIRAQLVVGRLGERGDVIGDELHLLPQPAADDGVVLVQPERHRLAAIDFLLHPVPDQSLQFLAGGRTLPGAGEALRHRRDLPLRDDDLSRLVAAAFGHQTVGRENRGPQQEEMQQRLAQESFHRLAVRGYFAGVYQIGEV